MIILFSNHKTISSFNQSASEVLRHTQRQNCQHNSGFEQKNLDLLHAQLEIFSDFSQFKIVFPIALADFEQCDNDNVKRDLSTFFLLTSLKKKTYPYLFHSWIN